MTPATEFEKFARSISEKCDLEFRKPQFELAMAIWKSLCRERHFIGEGPTGTGKTFAYLLRAPLFYCLEN